MFTQKLTFKWKKNIGRFATGESLFINRIRVAGYEWNATRSRDEQGNQYAGTVSLPSLNESGRVYSDSEKEIKLKIEGIVNRWFEEVLKEV